ncbi:anti-sigma factor [Roseovarius salinarum]|uniref:anti-sigma factor n=1 Tax=Roseovarius salinarum TaxID=1981892 RepID=UPI000C342C7C|nr:anti-sigma factor [Roseovarius salinarum]
MSDHDIPERDEDEVLAGEYALGLLPPDERAAFESRLSQDPELRALVARWQEDFAGLTEDIAPVAPPARVLPALEAQIFGPEQGAGRAGHGLWRLLAGAAAACVLIVALAVVTGVLDTGPTRPGDPAYVAEVAAEDESLLVEAAFDAEDGTLYVDRRRGGPRPGRALELWLIAGDDAPVSLGVLPDDPEAELPVSPDLRDRLAGGTLAISDEPPGGSPTGAPTGDVLAVGQITDS